MSKLQILLSFYQTVLMVFLPGFFASLFGIPLGIILFITRFPCICDRPYLRKSLSMFVNLLRSIPFIILLVILTPFTRWLIGTSIGTFAAIVPLTISCIPFLSRLIESTLNELDVGLIEAAQSMGASTTQIVAKVILPEAMPGIISAITVTLVNLVGYSAMAGVVGGGGLGDMAIRYGYQRGETKIMFFVLVILIIFVHLLQAIGAKLCIMRR